MEQQDFLNEMDENKLPSTLNVLTILTFIGSGLAIIIAALTPWLMKFSKSFIDKALSDESAVAKLSPKQLDDMRKSNEMFELVSKNFSITIPVTIICAVACIVGAVMMRKRKKDGFVIYTVAELLPLVVSLILMGTAQFTGMLSMIAAFGLPLLFIILYSVQRKHLNN